MGVRVCWDWRKGAMICGKGALSWGKDVLGLG